MPNMGFAAAILACLVTTCLMEAHAYLCSSKSDCAYKGCADVPCTISSSYCKNGVWDHVCCEGYCMLGVGDCGGMMCPAPNSCAGAPLAATAIFVASLSLALALAS